jgi:hypothetical protein
MILGPMVLPAALFVIQLVSHGILGSGRVYWGVESSVPGSPSRAVRQAAGESWFDRVCRFLFLNAMQ